MAEIKKTTSKAAAPKKAAAARTGAAGTTAKKVTARKTAAPQKETAAKTAAASTAPADKLIKNVGDGPIIHKEERKMAQEALGMVETRGLSSTLLRHLTQMVQSSRRYSGWYREDRFRTGNCYGTW